MGGALSGCCGVEEEPPSSFQSRTRAPHFAREEPPAQQRVKPSTKSSQRTETDDAKLKRERIQQATEERLKKVKVRVYKLFNI